MKRTTEELKAVLLTRYEAALDELLERCEETDNFGELEEQVAVFAEAALPATLSELQQHNNSSFPP